MDEKIINIAYGAERDSVIALTNRGRIFQIYLSSPTRGWDEVPNPKQLDIYKEPR